MSKVFLAKLKGGRPSTQEKLELMLTQKVLPQYVYALHPGRLARALGDALPQAQGVLNILEDSLLPPTHDPFSLFRQPYDEVPPGAVKRVKLLLKKRFPEAPS